MFSLGTYFCFNFGGILDKLRFNIEKLKTLKNIEIINYIFSIYILVL